VGEVTLDELVEAGVAAGYAQSCTSVGYEEDGGGAHTNFSLAACGSESSTWRTVVLTDLLDLELCTRCRWDDVLLEAGWSGEARLRDALAVLSDLEDLPGVLAGLGYDEVLASWERAHGVLTDAEQLAEVRVAVGAELTGRLRGDAVRAAAEVVVARTASWLSGAGQRQVVEVLVAEDEDVVLELAPKLAGTGVLDSKEVTSCVLRAGLVDGSGAGSVRLVVVPRLVLEAFKLSVSSQCASEVLAVEPVGGASTEDLEAAAVLLAGNRAMGLAEALEVARAL
jgi:hypothetical protein